MATQFYYKREWLEQIYALNNWQFFDCAESILYSSEALLSQNLMMIKSEFIIFHRTNEKLLKVVLHLLGFELIKIKSIAYNQAKIWIRPFPYTDSRCRAKELQTH